MSEESTMDSPEARTGWLRRSPGWWSRWRAWLLLGLSLALGGCSETPPDSTADSAPAAPIARGHVVEYPPHVYNPKPYGAFSQAIPIVNDTPQTVKFGKIRSDCGWSDATLAADELAPGESTTLHVKLHLKGLSGVRAVSIVLEAEPGPPWRYTLEVPAFPKYAFDSQDLYLGTLALGEVVTRRPVLYTYAIPPEEPSVLAGVVCDSEQVEVVAEPGSVEVVQGGVARRAVPLRLTIRTSAKAGQYASRVIASCREPSAEKPFEASLGLVWTVRSAYNVVPERLFLGDLRNDTLPVVREVTLRRRDGEPLALRRATAGHRAIQCSFAQGDPCEKKLTLTVDPAAVDGPLWTEVTVETDYPVQPLVTIPVALLK